MTILAYKSKKARQNYLLSIVVALLLACSMLSTLLRNGFDGYCAAMVAILAVVTTFSVRNLLKLQKKPNELILTDETHLYLHDNTSGTEQFLLSEIQGITMRQTKNPAGSFPYGSLEIHTAARNYLVGPIESLKTVAEAILSHTEQKLS